MCSMFGGRGVEIAAESATNSSTVASASAALKRRSWPIVDERLAHARAAQRAGHVTGHHPDVVGQFQQAMEAVEEPFGTVACVDGEVGPRRGAHEQRIAGQQGVAGEEAAVLRPVAGRVQRPDRDRADGDLVSILERIVRVCGAGAAVHRHRQPVLQRKPAVPGDVVGVRVRLEHAHPEAARGGLLEEGLDRVRGSTSTASPASSSPIRYDAQPRSSSTNWRRYIEASTYHRHPLYFLKSARQCLALRCDGSVPIHPQGSCRTVVARSCLREAR